MSQSGAYSGDQRVRIGQQLEHFSGYGYSRGRSLAWQSAWWIVSNAVWQKWWFPSRFRPTVLRLFGAQIGQGCLIRSRVRVHWPWKLELGDNCWIGEGAWLLNLERVSVGDRVCISQEALLCTGSHDPYSKTFEFDNGPITVDDESWIAARAIILRGVNIPSRTVVGAGMLVRK